MLEKLVTFDQQITEDGIINVRTITRVLEDGEELSKSYHRHTVNPKDDTVNEDGITKKIANAIYTPEFVTAYEAKIAIQEAEFKEVEPIEEEK